MTTTPPDSDPGSPDPGSPDPDETEPARPDPDRSGPVGADDPTEQPVDPRRPGTGAGEKLAAGDEAAAERYVDSPGAGLAGALDDLPEPNEPG